MIKQWIEEIPQFPNTNPRRCYAYLPTSYYKDTSKRYPVLYMFDGQNVFLDEDATYGKSWGLKSYLDFTDTELIVAAVECNSGADNGRLSEYAPYSFRDPNLGSFIGKGEQTMEWIVNTFKPQIDSIFRTIPDREHTYIAGSSMGGLMSFYALFKYNAWFSKAAALSPSLIFNSRELLSLVQSTQIDPDTTLYMDYGSEEFGYKPVMPKLYRKFCKVLLKKQVYLTSRIVPKGEHNEATWEKQLPFMIHTLIY